MGSHRRYQRLFGYTLPDGTRLDYVPWRPLEAKHAGIDPVRAQD